MGAEKDSDPKEAAAPIKRFQIGFNVLVQVFIGTMLFFVVNYLSCRHHQHWDLTHERDYTLSNATTNFIEQKLDKEARIIGFLPSEHPLFRDVSATLEEYARHGGTKVKVEMVDPGRNPVRSEELKNDLKINLNTAGVIVDVEGKAKLIADDRLFLRDPSAQHNELIGDYIAEALITSALVNASLKEAKRIYVIAGKGQLEADADGKTALNTLERFAADQFAVIVPLRFTDVDKIPEDADALVLLNAKVDFSPREISVLRDYWDNARGAFLIMLNPRGKTANLNSFIESYGVVPRDDRILFAAIGPKGPEKSFSVQSNFVPGSPITKDLALLSTTFTGQTQSLAKIRDPKFEAANIVHTPLLEAARRFWGETRFFDKIPAADADDNLAPLYPAIAIEKGAVADAAIRIDSSRMVVIGNSTLLDPGTLLPQNFDFVAASLNWMLDREELIGITAKRKREFKVVITPEQNRSVFWIVTIVLPGAVLAFGLFIWSVRRS